MAAKLISLEGPDDKNCAQAVVEHSHLFGLIKYQQTYMATPDWWNQSLWRWTAKPTDKVVNEELNSQLSSWLYKRILKEL